MQQINISKKNKAQSRLEYAYEYTESLIKMVEGVLYNGEKRTS